MSLLGPNGFFEKLLRSCPGYALVGSSVARAIFKGVSKKPLGPSKERHPGQSLTWTDSATATCLNAKCGVNLPPPN